MDKLKEASEQLADLNVKLAEQRIVLAEKSTSCEALLDEIGTNTTVGQYIPVSLNIGLYVIDTEYCRLPKLNTAVTNHLSITFPSS